MKKLRCRLGLHTWTNWSGPFHANWKDSQAPDELRLMRTCIECGKQQTMRGESLSKRRTPPK